MTGGLPGLLLIMRVSAAAIAMSALAFQSAPAAAQSVAEFYRGKTIKLLLPTAPGGGRALYALPFSEAFGRHIPGNPKILPVFMPGAGGSTAINNASGVAEPDGLTIVSPLKGAVAAQAIGDPSVRYDLSKFNWIGRITDATQIFFLQARFRRAPSKTSGSRRSSSAQSAVHPLPISFQPSAITCWEPNSRS